MVLVKAMNFMTKEKPYNALTAYYAWKYNSKVAKIALNAGFTCPNRDGRKGYGGCTYCSKLGSGDLAGNPEKELFRQFNDIRTVMEKKWPSILYIPYLQSYSNTYAPLEKLKRIYTEVLSFCPEKTVQISIATRPDCLSEEIVEYLGELNRKISVQIELGLQTANEETAKRINRRSTNEEFVQAVKRLRTHNIEVVAHIINGLPYESQKDMLNTVFFLNRLDIQGIKFHSLLILKDTALAEEYETLPFPLLSLEEYTEITAQQITHLKPSVIIHRLAADGVQKDLVAPDWSKKKLVVMNEIDKLLRSRNDYQGKYYKDAK